MLGCLAQTISVININFSTLSVGCMAVWAKHPHINMSVYSKARPRDAVAPTGFIFFVHGGLGEVLLIYFNGRLVGAIASRATISAINNNLYTLVASPRPSRL